MDSVNQTDSVKQDGVKNSDIGGFIGISSKFALLNRLITRDLNNNMETPTFALFSKEDIQNYLKNPYRNEKNLRKAVIYLYNASPHFRRLIQYFAGLSDFAYIISPYKIDPQTVNQKTLSRNYRKTLNAMSSMNVKTQLHNIVTVALKEDVHYTTTWITNDNITFQRLPSDYCSISSIEGNVLNVSFDFSYFNSHLSMLENYPPEFKAKYEIYKNNKRNKWIDLDSPTSFAIKCNKDILDYAIPPFAGILREVYDLEDYKQLKLVRTALENYAMIAMELPMNDDGEWILDYKKAKEFWGNLDGVLPPEIGSILTPMKLEKIGFERSNTGDIDTVADAEQNLFSAAGVSSLLFNNEKASANALSLSIKADQAITYGIVKSIEDAINRLIQAQPYGKNFKVTFLDCSVYNRKELGDQYLKAAQYGLPTVMMYAASQGLGQAEFDSMNLLENDILKLKDVLIPLKSSTQLSSKTSDSEAPTDEGGRPVKDNEDLTESGEQNREDA